jgi:hypothetical protein
VNGLTAFLTALLRRTAAVVRRRLPAAVVLGVALLVSLAGAGYALWQAAATGSGAAHASFDLRAPSVTASAISRTAGSATPVRQGGSFTIYANLSDAGSPPSGLATATANVSSIATGATAVPLTACTTSCTLDATTYGYRSGAQVANSPLASGSYTYSVTMTDHVGNTGTVGGLVVVVNNDTTAPVLSALEIFDSNTNGKVDQVKATFSETLASYSAGTGPWTLANVPSGGTLSSVSVTGSVATLTVAEGSGAATTAVGSFTVALAANPNGIRDAAGNQSSFAATAPADKAAPVLVSGSSANGGSTAGLMQASDTLTLVFSEALDPASVPGTVTVTEARSGGSSTLTIPGLIQTANVSNSYLGGNSSSGTSTATVSRPNASTVAVTLGSVTTTGSGVAAGTGSVTVKPDASLKDAAGNAVVTGSSAVVSRLF